MNTLQDNDFKQPPFVTDMEELIGRIVASSDDTDGSEVLPPALHVEPGTFIWALYEVWSGIRVEEKALTHSFRNLETWLQELPIKVSSLHHRLKGRYPLSKPEAESLLIVLLSNWKVQAGKAQPAIDKPFAAAGKIANVLFGPINKIVQKEIFVRSSPGIDGSEFFHRHRSNEAIIIPVLDRALFGPDPISAIQGSLFSLRRALGGPDSCVSIVWLLRGETPRHGDEFARYLYERSFLTTLLQLVEVSAQLKPDANEILPFPKVEEVRKRMFVCVHAPHAISKSLGKMHESEVIELTDFVPYRTPRNWEREVEGLNILTTHSFTVCAKDSRLHYWINERGGDRISFRELTTSPSGHIEEAHQLVVSAVAESRRSKKKTADARLRSLGWMFLSSAQFLAGDDLQIARSS